LADSGFGGERSRGWGYADAPEFVEGALPDMILQSPEAKNQKAANTIASAAVPEPGEARTNAEQSADTPVASGAVAESPSPAEPSAAVEPAPSESVVPEPSVVSETPVPETASTATEPSGSSELGVSQTAVTPPVNGAARSRMAGYWLLSLFTPAPADSVDWGRGNYAVIARGGRVDSAAGSGQLKKQVRMIAEGSVLYASGILRGAAPDVAPDGFAHPVFRAGFAVAIPLPEAS
jgi:CRISPR/Cas system CSM-associated protein Csm4 (group 5 of RAMP superfamily)